MRGKLPPGTWTERTDELAEVCHRLRHPRQRAHFARELMPWGGGHPIDSACRRLEHHPVALLAHTQWGNHVIQQGLLWEGSEERPTHRADRTGIADGGSQATLGS